jgi:hypothetical protein
MDKKISALDLVTVLDTGDVLPIVNQATTKKVTVAKLIDGLATTTYVNNQDALKVDKVTGKGLSTEDYTTVEKSKLAGIQAGAEVNVNADWNAVSGDAQILNKPTIPSAVTQTSQLTNNGADGVNPFITALDIPIAGQASTLVREVKNMTGATLTKGTVVYISGANGNKALVSKALATTDALSSRTFGMLQSDILNNGLGNCVIIGDLTGVDTSTFAEGDQLYLSGVTAGTYTASKILAPTHLVYVGKVTRVHPTLGQIEVGIQNGYELEEIHDVAISGLANEDFLQYELSTDLWKNKPLTDTLIKSKLGITTLSGSNTGDNATNTQYSGLATSKQNVITLTTTGTSGASTLIGDTLNIPQYTGGGGSSSQSAFTILANNTNATALPTEQPFENITNDVYSGIIVWTGGAAPSGTTSHTYSLSQVGNLVTLTINLAYGAAGASTLTNVTIELPSTAPQPEAPSSVTTVGDILSIVNGNITTTKLVPAANAVSIIRLKSTSPNVFEISISRAAAAYRYAYATIQYFV